MTGPNESAEQPRLPKRDSESERWRYDDTATAIPAPALSAVPNGRMGRNRPNLSRAATFRTEYAPQTTSQNALTLVRTLRPDARPDSARGKVAICDTFVLCAVGTTVRDASGHGSDRPQRARTAPARPTHRPKLQNRRGSGSILKKMLMSTRGAGPGAGRRTGRSAHRRRAGCCRPGRPAR